MASQGQERPRAHRHRRDPLGVECHDQRCGDRQVAEVLPRLAPPERECLVDQRGRRRGVGLRGGLGRQPAEPRSVDLDTVGAQPIGPALRDQSVPVGTERGAQARHIDVEAPQRIGRAGVAPDLVDHPCCGDSCRRVRRNGAEHGAAHARTQVDGDAVGSDLERPEHSDVKAG